MYLTSIINIFLHLDNYLSDLIIQYQTGVYFIVFFVILFETGLIIAPFLPGDSLLFALGGFAAIGSLNLYLLLILLSIAAILGDSLNYFIGKKLGRKVFRENRRFLNQNHLEMTEKFYERHGKKTIIYARFMPIIRTVAPFVAGVGKMNYLHFFMYNVIGGIIWVFLFVLGGYFLGNIPIVKENFTLFILGIIFISLMPIFVKVIGHYFIKRNKKV